MQLPDLDTFTTHRTVHDATFEGTAIPGLTGTFYRRSEPDGARVASVGRYHYHGAELFMAWGYTDEEHCRWTAYRRPDGSWTAPRQGCPQIRFTDAGPTFIDHDSGSAVSENDPRPVVVTPVAVNPGSMR